MRLSLTDSPKTKCLLRLMVGRGIESKSNNDTDDTDFLQKANHKNNAAYFDRRLTGNGKCEFFGPFIISRKLCVIFSVAS